MECKVIGKPIKIIRKFPIDNIFFAREIKRGDTFILDLEKSV